MKYLILFLAVILFSCGHHLQKQDRDVLLQNSWGYISGSYLDVVVSFDTERHDITGQGILFLDEHFVIYSGEARLGVITKVNDSGFTFMSSENEEGHYANTIAPVRKK